jgi:hypothetical protein
MLILKLLLVFLATFSFEEQLPLDLLRAGLHLLSPRLHVRLALCVLLQLTVSLSHSFL